MRIILNYNEIRQQLELLNKDPTHYNNSNDICTPMQCVEEMIDTIPQEFWSRKDISILDPCAGNGNFPAYILYKLELFNNNDFLLYINEINEKRFNNINQLFDVKDNRIIISNNDFLTMDDSNKYDLIVANPPYAKITNGKRAAKNHNVSRSFIEKAVELTKDNGYIVFIVPDNWMSLADRNNIPQLLTQYQFIHLDIHRAKKYFPKVGSSFTWFIAKKDKPKDPFTISNGYKLKTDDKVFIDKTLHSIPLYYNNDVKSIIEKTLMSNNKKIKIETTSYLHRYTKKRFLSTIKDTTHKYRIKHTLNQELYSSIPHKYQDGWKVFISLTSYYETMIDNCGMTQSIAFVRTKNLEEAKEIKHILDHPLYVFLNDIHRYGNFNNIRILQQFPYPNDTNNIFNSFNINEREQELIKKFLREENK